MIIQYISDIHLEIWHKNPKIKIKAEIICVCGDIGDPFSKIYKQFLTYLSENFRKVFIIFGNHEYYKKDNYYNMNEVNDYVKNLIKGNNLSNISFLDNSYEDYEGYRFVGSILWSKISDNNYLINDFNYIRDMTVSKYNNLHDRDINYLRSVIEESDEKKLIILTHHMPSYDLIDDIYKTKDMIKYNQCFASDCSELFRENVKLWIYGHTHKCRISSIKGIKFVCNPRGYPSEMRDINVINIVEV